MQSQGFPPPPVGGYQPCLLHDSTPNPFGARPGREA